MTKEEIMNTYAIEQGYESWYQLVVFRDYNSTDRVIEMQQHYNKVTDLIQEELKKKIYKDVSESVLGDIFKCDMLEDKILKIEKL